MYECITYTYLPPCFIGWWGLIRLSLSNWIYKCVLRFCVLFLITNDYKCLELKLKTPRGYRGVCRENLVFSSSDSGETRTHGQWLKRPLLYQLSYRVEIDVKFTKNKKIISYNFLNIFI